MFRIDHFLGKEPVDNLLACRFANGLLEPVWNRNHISYVQIDVPETLPVAGRCGFHLAGAKPGPVAKARTAVRDLLRDPR